MGDYGHDLEFGVFVEPAAQSADQVVGLAAFAEEAGFDLVTFNDHPYSPRSLDAWTLMSFVAARTGRVRLAANVTSLPLRPPAVLAQAVASSVTSRSIRPGTTNPKDRDARLRCADTSGHDGPTHHNVDPRGFEPLISWLPARAA